jgi:hypothetical protein
MTKIRSFLSLSSTRRSIISPGLFSSSRESAGSRLTWPADAGRCLPFGSQSTVSFRSPGWDVNFARGGWAHAITSALGWRLIRLLASLSEQLGDGTAM